MRDPDTAAEPTIRPFRDEDADATARIYFDAVRVGAAAHYTEAEREAWAPRVPKIGPWRDRLSQSIAFVAVRDARIVGFMALRRDGYLDLAFVAPDAARTGVGTKLYRALEAEARHAGLTSLDTEASRVARPFFARHGWTVVAEQSVCRGCLSLPNFRMEKRLA